jgi:hypothetical protein
LVTDCRLPGRTVIQSQWPPVGGNEHQTTVLK